MKITNKLLLISLLAGTCLATSSMALSAKTEQTKIVEGTTVGKYAKPGASVDMKYTSEHVSVGDVSKVEIVLLSHARSGKMNVIVKVDKGLNEVSSVVKHLSFDLNDGKKEYPLTLEVFADDDGVYYVKLLVSLKGKGMRAFSVPVYVGDGLVKTKKSPIKKTDKGEKISVSEAQETVIKE